MNGVRAALHGQKFAVIYVNGHQFKVTEGDRVQLAHPLWADIGEQIRLKKVLMVGGERFTAIGRPLVEGASVEATVEEQFKSKLQYQFRKVIQDVGGRWIDVQHNSTIFKIDKINFEPEMKVEGRDDEFYKIADVSEAEANQLDAEETALEPVRWSAGVNGPIWDQPHQPQLSPEVAEFIKWRKTEQIQDRRYYSPGMRYWWWPKYRFESGMLSKSR
eukprot:TRINITY_DN59453_c0_g1_i1.p2 TRINITY_DN59453_c0_g1~~TRINITY_DN59453_c0_g1_i1.p2  ORF type:complete len:234 (+),score=88.45 TRINITY_DN59453_c0_g1_i1:52-702(+)